MHRTTCVKECPVIGGADTFLPDPCDINCLNAYYQTAGNAPASDKQLECATNTAVSNCYGITPVSDGLNFNSGAAPANYEDTL